MVPKNLGYAGIAGVPLQNGLYAAAAGAHHLPDLLHVAAHLDRPELVARGGRGRRGRSPTGVGGEAGGAARGGHHAATGVLFVALAVLRTGWIAQFLSSAVITGFLAGAAVDVVIGELPKLTGTSSEGDTAWRELASWLGALGDVDWTTALVAAAALAAVLSLRRLAPAVPGALVLVAGGLIASHLFALGEHGVALVGDVPRGLPAPSCPTSPSSGTTTRPIGIAAVALVLIGFAQTAGDARAFAARHHYRIDVDQESVAQGMANVGAGRVPGHARVDEPLGQLAQRVGRARGPRSPR